MFHVTIIVLLISIAGRCYGVFEVPDIILEAFEPQGFKASIPAMTGIQQFAFHGNINKDIAQSEPGEINQETIKPDSDKIWSIMNRSLKLNIGDKINYWVFVQFENLGYRKDHGVWTVSEFRPITPEVCETTSYSIVSDKSNLCSGAVIFQDQFKENMINNQKWTIEQYIPFNDPNFDFVSYQYNPDVCYINKDALFIKPKPDNSLRNEIDLRGICTRESDEECYIRMEAQVIAPPITSAKLVSKIRFRYGIIEVRAKLPAGDWLYPQVYLESVSNLNRSIWIAYARGNNIYKAANNEDYGSRLLFGGPITSPVEPKRSTLLSTKKSSKPFTSAMHTYKIKWTKDLITVSVDGEEYGSTPTSRWDIGNNENMRVVLGVGAGGILEFPDGFQSGGQERPWKITTPKLVRQFFNARSQWMSTWHGDDAALQVDYVKVTAI